MDSPERKKLQGLLDRYLNPTVGWTEADDRNMRQLVREHDDCAEYYDRAVTIHRMMVGAEPGQPSGFEHDRMMQVVLDATAEKAPKKSWLSAWMPSLAGAMSAAAVLLFVVMGTPEFSDSALGPDKGPAGEEDYIGSRGGAQEKAVVSLDISGVLAADNASSATVDREYNPIEDGFFYGDLLKFYTSNRTDALAHVVIVGVQEGQKPLWFAPHPAMGTTQSLVAAPGALMPVRNPADPLDQNGVLFDAKATPWQVGALTIVAVFTPTPLERAEVTAVLQQAAPGSDWTRVLTQGLALPESSVVQTTTVTVRPGSHSETVNER